jgi:4-hydroxy-3-polyprenylbenzoate decarboxylase
MGTLGTIASGAMSLIHRAASVALKEEQARPDAAGDAALGDPPAEHAHAAICRRDDPVPRAGLHHGAETVDDLVDFIVGRTLDQLGLENALVRRWGQP